MIDSLDVEAAVLGALMQDNRLIDQACEALDPADFSAPLHSRIYSAIVREAMNGNAVNPVLLRGFFEDDPGFDEFGGIVYLMRLTSDDNTFIARELISQLREIAERRRMQAGLETAANACGDLDTPIPEIVAHADAALVTQGKDTIHQPTGAEAIAELIDGFGQGDLGVTCGVIPDLDALLGQMRPKQLVIGAGRPGMGKTALALSYSIGAAKAGHGVLFVSLEMSAKELAARMVADMCFDGREGVPYHCIRDGELNNWQHRRVAEVASAAHALPFQIIDAGSLSVGRLAMLVRRHARRMAAKGTKLELVVVDYLQLLHPDSKGRSNYEAVSEVSRSLKAMAKDNGIAVFALAQLSREVEKRPDRRPQLSDLRDSGQIEQDADAVLFLLRQEYYLRQAEPDQLSPERAEWEHALNGVAGQIEFILAKRRNGVIGNATGRFYGAYQAVR